MKRKPTGFVAKCQCGVYVGAMDHERTPQQDIGKILGQWLADGCVVEPRFEGAWQETISSCRCD